MTGACSDCASSPLGCRDGDMAPPRNPSSRGGALAAAGLMFFLAFTLLMLLYIAICADATPGDSTRRQAKLSPGVAALDSAEGVWEQTEVLLQMARHTGDTALLGEAEGLAAEAQRLATDLHPPPASTLTLANGTHYWADYDVAKPLRPPRGEYGYGESPAFRYPEDVKGGSLARHKHAIVSYIPRTYVIDSFLSRSEAANVIRLATPKMHRSEVARFATDPKNEDAVDESRTSSGAWLDDDAFAKGIKDRIHNLTGLPREHFEQFQILRYQKGQRYEAHHDYFDPRLYGEQATNRVATFYIFLSETFEEGEFNLPRANKGRQPDNLRTCNQGLKVKPKVGSAVLFYGMKPNRHLDRYSLHTGCTVGSGVKWSMVLWMQTEGNSFSDPGD